MTTRLTDGSLAIYPERLVKRGRRVGRAAVTTVRLDVRLDAATAERADEAASRLGLTIDQFVALAINGAAA